MAGPTPRRALRAALTLTVAIANLKVLGITIPLADLTGLTPTSGGTSVTSLAGVTLPTLPSRRD